MNSYTSNVENSAYTMSDSFKKPNLSNIIPNSWKKFGEVYSNKFEQAVFVCLICLEKADCINNAYTICDGLAFWAHIQQQHISKEYETIEKISAELQKYQSNCIQTVEVDSNIADPTNYNFDKVEKNQIKTFEKSNENVENNEPSEDNKYNMILGKEGNKTNEDIKPNIKEERNQKYASNFLNSNYFYEETDSLTISDDEENDDDDKEDGIQKLPTVNSDRRETDYLRHNDMIEISDDDEDDKEFIDTRQNSFDLLHDKKLINDAIITDDIEHRKGINSTDLKESFLSPGNVCAINAVCCIPTPETSPCESVANQQSNSTFNFQYTNQVTGYEKDTQSNEFQSHSKKKVQKFRAFQCKVCHSRTINEKNMQTHIQRIHGNLAQEIGPNQINYKQYHRIQQFSEYSEPDSPQSCVDLKAQKKLVKCNSCKTQTATTKSMERHQQIYHSPDSHLFTTQCQICLKRVLRKKFKQHMKRHNSTEFQCIYCGVVYRHKHYLNFHINKYHADKNVSAVPKYPQRFATNLHLSNDISMPARLTPDEEYQMMYHFSRNSNSFAPPQYP